MDEKALRKLLERSKAGELTIDEVVQILRKINDLGTTVIMTTHNKGVIEEIERRVITMDDGRIVRDDSSGKYVL